MNSIYNLPVIIGRVEVFKNGIFANNKRNILHFFFLKKFFDFFKKECEKVNNIFLKVEIKKLVENCLCYVK